MTTGGPDTGDTFEETIQDGKYLFRGEWKPLRVEHEQVGIARNGKIEWRDDTFPYTHHGRLWAREEGKAYFIATPPSTQFRLLGEAYPPITARSLGAVKDDTPIRQHHAQK